MTEAAKVMSDIPAYVRAFGDTIDSAGVYWYSNLSQKTDTSFYGLGTAKKPTFNEEGSQEVRSADHYVVVMYIAAGRRQLCAACIRLLVL